MTKHSFISFLFLVSMMMSLPASAASPNDGDEDDDNMFVYTNNLGSPATYSLDNLDKITFSDDAVQVWTGAASSPYKYDGLLWISFGKTGYPLGDVNHDTKVDISDIVSIINTIAGTKPNIISDVNADTATDISDIVSVINIIANGK